jgi:hypothetical protein
MVIMVNGTDAPIDDSLTGPIPAVAPSLSMPVPITVSCRPVYNCDVLSMERHSNNLFTLVTNR